MNKKNNKYYYKKKSKRSGKWILAGLIAIPLIYAGTLCTYYAITTGNVAGIKNTTGTTEEQAKERLHLDVNRSSTANIFGDNEYPITLNDDYSLLTDVEYSLFGDNIRAVADKPNNQLYNMIKISYSLAEQYLKISDASATDIVNNSNLTTTLFFKVKDLSHFGSDTDIKMLLTLDGIYEADLAATLDRSTSILSVELPLHYLTRIVGTKEEMYLIPKYRYSGMLCAGKNIGDSIDVNSNFNGKWVMSFNNFGGSTGLYDMTKFDMIIYKRKPKRKPVLIDGASKDIYLNIDDEVTLETIKSQIVAKDFYGVDVPFTIASTTYEIGKLGDFELVLNAEDVYGNTAVATLKVHVLDYSAPLITKKTEDIYVPFNEPEKAGYDPSVDDSELLNWYINFIKENFTITDNVEVYNLDDILNQKTIELLDDGDIVFTNDSTKEATASFKYPSSSTGESFTYTLAVSDTRNTSYFDFDVFGLDINAPVISSKFESDVHEISVLNANSFYVNQILSKYKAVDDVDGELAIKTSGKGISEAVGDYKYTLTATDNAGNMATKVVTIKVKNDVKPYFKLTEALWLIDANNPLDISTINNIILVKEDLLITDIYDLSVDASAYLLQPDKAGDYSVQYQIKTKSGSTINSDLVLRVSGSKKSWFEKNIKDPVVTFFKKLANWLSFRGWTLC